MQPEKIKSVFYLGQIAVGALLIGILWLLRSRGSESGFRSREADQPRKPTPLKPGAEDPLANARIQKKEPLLLPGIRLDGTPHQILGVTPGATEAEVQKAYRELMKRYHPDKVGPPGSRQWNDVQKIAEAINRARDEILRKRK